MSGHSKWSTIKRDKGVNDAKRGQAFTKAANVITTSAKEGGGNPDMNFKLRLAMEAARSINMPKDNIDRAIARGAGGSSGVSLENVDYEGYGPGGVAIIVETLTDNKQRTAASVRSLFDKSGGNLGGPGSVAWMFKNVGQIVLKLSGRDPEELSLAVIDLGAEDFEITDDELIIYTSTTNLESLKKALETAGYEISQSELIKRPINLVKVTDPGTAKSILNVMDKLEELDDVLKVSSNFDIEDTVLKQLVT